MSSGKRKENLPYKKRTLPLGLLIKKKKRSSKTEMMTDTHIIRFDIRKLQINGRLRNYLIEQSILKYIYIMLVLCLKEE